MSNAALRRLSVRCAGLAAVLAIVWSLAPLRPASTTWTPLPAPQHLVSELPLALQASLSRQGVTLVAALAADIDADGDLDIVGSDDHLAVIVLVNDGHGHFSRRSPRPQSWSAEPADPVVHDRGAAPTVSVQTDRPSFDSGFRVEFRMSDPATIVRATAHHASARSRLATRTPRAPPVALRA